MKIDRKPVSPLPAALLTLAVVVCLGGVAQAGALPIAQAVQQRGAVIADREGLGQWVAAFAQAARKQGHHHETQPALCGSGSQHTWVRRASALCDPSLAHHVPAPAPLRAELTHLPPPALG